MKYPAQIVGFYVEGAMHIKITRISYSNNHKIEKTNWKSPFFGLKIPIFGLKLQL